MPIFDILGRFECVCLYSYAVFRACTIAGGFVGISVGLDVAVRALCCVVARNDSTCISSPYVSGVPTGLGYLDLANKGAVRFKLYPGMRVKGA